MGEKADRIERHIQQQRDEFGHNIVELKQKVKRSVDWRSQVEERPLTMIGLAFGGGALLSVLLSGRSGSRFAAPSTGDRGMYQELAGSNTLEILKGALIGLAATKLKEFVEELIPGFQEEYKRAAGSKSSY